MKKQLVYTLLLFIISSTPIISNAADLGEAESKVANAEVGVGEAYQYVVMAEREGGDVSDLVYRLNDAIDMLGKADRRLDSGDYDEAVTYAELATRESREILDDARSLRSRAVSRGEREFRNQVVLSATLTIFIAMFGYAGWFYFRRFYMRRIAKAKPGVVEDES